MLYICIFIWLHWILVAAGGIFSLRWSMWMPPAVDVQSPNRRTARESRGKVTQSRLTLWDRPVDCIPPGSSVHVILQARMLEWAAISFSRGSPKAGGLNLGLLPRRQILYHLNHEESPDYQGGPLMFILVDLYSTYNIVLTSAVHKVTQSYTRVHSFI